MQLQSGTTFGVMVALAAWLPAATFGAHCPNSDMTVVSSFTAVDGSAWTACEDLQQPSGAIALLRSSQERADGPISEVKWFSKTHEQYGSAPAGSDDFYYLNFTKKAAVAAAEDVLGIKLLSNNYSHLTWDLVASAVPPIRHAGVRAFVGSRGSAVDTTFDDAGGDAAEYGFPAPTDVFNASNQAEVSRCISLVRNSRLIVNCRLSSHSAHFARANIIMRISATVRVGRVALQLSISTSMSTSL